MPSTHQPFCATTWINQLGNGVHLRGETIQVVSSFALMWNIFENGLCANNADIGKLENISSQIRFTPELLEQIDRSLSYFKNRYVTPSGFSYYFQGLNLRPSDRKPHVESILTGTDVSSKGQLFALLIIIYRFRNNLFHGLKQIEGLNEQVENLDTANRILATVLEAHGMQL